MKEKKVSVDMRRMCRWAYKSSSDIWAFVGPKGVTCPGRDVHGGPMFRGHLWSWAREVLPKGPLPEVRRWGKWARRRLHRRRWTGGGDRGDVCVGVYSLLCYRSQTKRKRFPRSCMHL